MTSGEEDETRIMQTSCKLYQFCPVGKTWVDRGGGTLRLNEKEQDGVSTSRLVVRSKAVMRVGNSQSHTSVLFDFQVFVTLELL